LRGDGFGWDGFGGFRSWDLFDLQATALIDILAEAEAQESVEGGFHDVGGIFGAEGFAQDVFNTGGFEDSANGFTGNDTCPGGGGTKEHPGAAVMSEHFVRNGGVLEAHPDHLRAGQFAAFTNGIGNLAGLSEADADATAPIANHDESAEVETTPAFNNLGGAVDEDDFFGQFLLVAFEAVVRVSGATAARPHTVAASGGRFGTFDGTFDGFGLIAVHRLGWFGHNIILHGH
jgi:hypothetical protein